jgi:ATP-dependent protease HslVU (ClpYQ) peptidase subunit
VTTLAAIQGDGWCVIGCDSRASDESGRHIAMATHKIIENGPYLIAGAGSSRGSNIIQFGWRPPKPPNTIHLLDEFMTRKFIPEMRKSFIEAGYDMKEDGQAAEHDSVFLVAVRGVIYPIFEDYSWDRDVNNIYYAGSGSNVALGALEVLSASKAKSPKQAEEYIRKAIAAAIKWDVFSGEPIVVKTQIGVRT